MIIHSTAGLIDRKSIRVIQYFPERYERSGGNMKVELDLSNFTVRTVLKGATGIDASPLQLKADLANLITK